MADNAFDPLPLTELHTERLTLRRIGAEDWPAVRDIWASVAGTPFAQYDRPNDLSEKAVAVRIEGWAQYKDSPAHMFLAVCLQEQVIGYLALHRREKGYELGYCFHTSFHGRGYARESLAALLEAAGKRGVRRVEAGTALKNTPSVRLLTALGFTLSGVEKVSFYRDENGNGIVFDGGVFVKQLQEA